jgi:hypothetical protein
MDVLGLGRQPKSSSRYDRSQGNLRISSCKVEMSAFLGARGPPMEEERIELSAKERERLKVLHEVEHGHLLQIAASRRLRLSDRQVR